MCRLIFIFRNILAPAGADEYIGPVLVESGVGGADGGEIVVGGESD